MTTWRAGGTEGRPVPKDSWRTPPELYARLDAEFHFALDAACTRANCLAPAGLYDGEVDALATPWHLLAPSAAIWLNPPYSNVRPWLRKAREASRRGCMVACLIPADTSTRWWSDLAARDASEIRFLVGRVRFHAEDGSGEHHTKGSGGSAIGPSAIAIYAADGGPPRHTYMPARVRHQHALPLAAEPDVTTFHRSFDHATGSWSIEVHGDHDARCSVKVK